MNKGQTTIPTGFDQVMSSNIRRSNDAQLEMAISDFFHYENIADQVVESTRCKYMLKQALLMGVTLDHQQGNNWRLQISFFDFLLVFSNIMKVDC